MLGIAVVNGAAVTERFFSRCSTQRANRVSAQLIRMNNAAATMYAGTVFANADPSVFDHVSNSE